MYHKILVPLDGSSLAELALPHAEAVARRFESEIRLVRVCQPVVMPLELYTFKPDMTDSYEQELQNQVESGAEEYLRHWQQVLQLKQLKSHYVVLHGSVSETILDVATTDAVDLIVMSTHGRSGLSRWVYGSVANKVLQHAPCPVLLIRAAAQTERS